MNTHAPATGEEADDVVTGNRCAALRQADEYVVESLDVNTGLSAAAPQLVGMQHRHRQALFGPFTLVTMSHALRNRLGSELAIAHGGEKRLDIGVAVRHRLLLEELAFHHVGDGKALEAELVLESLTTEFDQIIATLA